LPQRRCLADQRLRFCPRRQTATWTAWAKAHGSSCEMRAPCDAPLPPPTLPRCRVPGVAVALPFCGSTRRGKELECGMLSSVKVVHQITGGNQWHSDIQGQWQGGALRRTASLRCCGDPRRTQADRHQFGCGTGLCGLHGPYRPASAPSRARPGVASRRQGRDHHSRAVAGFIASDKKAWLAERVRNAATANPADHERRRPAGAQPEA